MLNQIIDRKREDILKIELPEDLKLPKRSFKKALLSPNRFVALIAEVKKASPSKGVIQENFEPVQIAKQYEQAKADCLSVLTDTPFFQGKNSYLSDVKRSVSLPVLRKDFIIDSIQVEEADRIGADAILLIGEALEPQKLFDLYQQAAEKGMDVLVEVHGEETLEGILNVFTPEIIGVNNRNLKTFETSVGQTERMAKLVPSGSVLISESGIGQSEDLAFVKACGARAVLVGESLMREPSQLKAVHALFGENG
ncbi:indole-3-glycerol phosphate synthase TrpC [Bacillus paralicheniformis]|jgi:indole-3-glycerol phosphate synthase|uniref:Indole-3-glycerol phosphate synthase n=1 Tax=Bacillus paralicheniformis TaxID=1648923 RepID=A0A6I7UA88_9BACI|nr:MULTISPECIES: indole-3-glycerol phosphate synthase TrpC [Bacillus]KJD52824.1 indole-3-glycerol phosphate synthase [Bacillus amyloliquefaciens]KUL06882.1 indole-3-glycerol phosphate synthase [Bacillus licheniformis LMG 7559]KUL18803.1 indole-3-glycerol phosphate synthase [Bacillus licheniformis LMG 6934]POO80738.1 indole-3-glycerol phosphate synthase TrpC [Bacillus sp. MBGLi97]AGN36837.1 indole-3-glycerol phosphate synthase TrpC [Bacillus paralicheniformis ATCC 9945a]